MEKSRNEFIKNFHYLCLIGIFTIGLMAIVASGGGGGGAGDGGGDGGGTQGNGTIQGIVQDATTQNPFKNASVSIQGTNLSDATDTQGRYAIEDVPVGTQTVEATAAGYTSQSTSVNVTADATVTVDFSLTPLTGTGETYYVATTGDDSNPGTMSQPWRTIQHASETMNPGDTVLIRGGVYNERVTTTRSGSAGNGYITFSAYQNETPVIDGTGITTGENGFVITHSYIKLLGLEITNWPGNGIWSENAGYLEISDCEVHHVCCGIGLFDGTHDFEINRVTAHHFDLYGFDASPSESADCYNGTFNDCIAHTGRDPEQNVDGFALGHGTQHDFVLNRCEVYAVYDGFDISSRNTTLNRCSAHECWNGGYKLWQDGVTLVNCLGYHNEGSNVEVDWDGDSGTTTLRNCTFVDAGVFNIWVENSGDSLHMYNCILAGGDNIGLAFELIGVANYRGDYNIFHNDDPNLAIVVGYTDESSLNQINAGDWTTYSGQDQHSLVSTNPTTELFQGLGEWDLHLIAGSIAIDQGTSENAPSVDYDGNPRPQGAGYDIGAYEY
jgi:hypothetical protein